MQQIYSNQCHAMKKEIEKLAVENKQLKWQHQISQTELRRFQNLKRDFTNHVFALENQIALLQKVDNDASSEIDKIKTEYENQIQQNDQLQKLTNQTLKLYRKNRKLLQKESEIYKIENRQFLDIICTQGSIIGTQQEFIDCLKQKLQYYENAVMVETPEKLLTTQNEPNIHRKVPSYYLEETRYENAMINRNETGKVSAVPKHMTVTADAFAPFQPLPVIKRESETSTVYNVTREGQCATANKTNETVNSPLDSDNDDNISIHGTFGDDEEPKDKKRKRKQRLASRNKRASHGLGISNSYKHSFPKYFSSHQN